jgi:hypothetical protein
LRCGMKWILRTWPDWLLMALLYAQQFKGF